MREGRRREDSAGRTPSLLPERARERKQATDSGERVVVGVNRFRREEGSGGVSEIFTLDPKAADEIRAKYEAVRDRRDDAAVTLALDRLSDAAQKDRENLLPHLVDCCHAYATVGEMVDTLKRHWGEFDEPVRL